MRFKLTFAILMVLAASLLVIAMPSSDADYEMTIGEISYDPDSGIVFVTGSSYCNVYLSVIANGYYSGDVLTAVENGAFSNEIHTGKLPRGMYRVSAVSVEDNLDYVVKPFPINGYVHIDSASLSRDDNKLSVSGYASDANVEITVSDVSGKILADGVPAVCSDCAYSTSFVLSEEICSDLTVTVSLPDEYAISDSTVVLSRQVNTDSEQEIALFTGESASVHLVVEGCTYSDLNLSSTDKTIATFGDVGDDGTVSIIAGFAEGTATIYVSVGASVIEFRVTVTEKVLPPEIRTYTFNLKVYYDAELADVGTSGLTILDLQQGITLTADDYNAGDALEKALTDLGVPCSFWTQESYKHWINQVMGLKEVKYDNGDYKYWIQYRHDENGNPVYNQWTLGWYTEGGTFDLIYGITDPDGKMVIPDDYTLVIDSNNGSYAVDSTSILSTLPSVQLPGSVNWTKEGCTAVGFNSMPDGSGDSFAFGQSVSMEYITAHSDTNRSAVFYVQWVADTVTYNVTYLCDSEQYSSEEYKMGAEVVIPDLPVKAGYRVSAWTSTDVTINHGKFVMPGNAVTISCTSELIPVQETQTDNGDGTTTTVTVTGTETADGYMKTETVETVTDSEGQTVSTKTNTQETKTDSTGSTVETNSETTVSGDVSVTKTDVTITDPDGNVSSVTNTVKTTGANTESTVTQDVDYSAESTVVEYTNESKDSEGNVDKVHAALELPNGSVDDVSDVGFTVFTVNKSELDDTVQKRIGDAPVFDLNLSASGVKISEFKKTVTVSIYYIPAPGESTKDLVVYHISDDGIVTKLACTYDETTHMVTFQVDHFSMYAVGHDSHMTESVLALGMAIVIVVVLSMSILASGIRKKS